jgi:polysaccharide biosynthesis protein PslH
MRILWVKTDYLHPTQRGGQIRTLEMLKRIHAHHEVDYLTLDDGTNEDGPRRTGEYCRKHYAVPHQAPGRHSARFWMEVLRGLFSSQPMAVFRWRSQAMGDKAGELIARERYDAVVCDFLVPAASLRDWKNLVLFQHNVEAQIWERHALNGPSWVHRWYFSRQAEKMAAFEGEVCRGVRKVIAVSEEDALLMRRRYGLTDVEAVPTGVDTAYFAADPGPMEAEARDLVFVGSMEWMPNEDGAVWLKREILPRIWKRRPETTVALVGRNPSKLVHSLAEGEPRILVTGTVADVRPWMRQAQISIVPLRVGGGTRLKVYEAIAAGVPVVSTTIGAEGLELAHGKHLLVGDSEDEFAEACLTLLRDRERAREIAATARKYVEENFSWDSVVMRFLELIALPHPAGGSR